MSSVPALANDTSDKHSFQTPLDFGGEGPGEALLRRAGLRRNWALRIMANAVHVINRLAHAFDRDLKNKWMFMDIKDALLSILIEHEFPGVVPKWQDQEDGRQLLVISIGERRAPHCPFDRLTPNAQCKVVNRIGPGSE